MNRALDVSWFSSHIIKDGLHKPRTINLTWNDGALQQLWEYQDPERIQADIAPKTRSEKYTTYELKASKFPDGMSIILDLQPLM